VLEAVDEAMDDALFEARRPGARRLRRMLDRRDARPGLAPPDA
jgi:hypothetical protein